MTQHKEINNLIISVFSSEPEVNLIFRSSGDDALIRVWVFTEGKKYDDALMDDLLECEILVLNEFPQRRFDFRYIPLVMCDDPVNAMDFAPIELYSK